MEDSVTSVSCGNIEFGKKFTMAEMKPNLMTPGICAAGLRCLVTGIVGKGTPEDTNQEELGSSDLFAVVMVGISSFC